MKTDSILEELYEIRNTMLQAAGGDFNLLFDQMRERHAAYEALHPEIKWVDFSRNKHKLAQVAGV